MWLQLYFYYYLIIFVKFIPIFEFYSKKLLTSINNNKKKRGYVIIRIKYIYICNILYSITSKNVYASIHNKHLTAFYFHSYQKGLLSFIRFIFIINFQIKTYTIYFT